MEVKVNVDTYKEEEDEKTCDVTNHSTEWDLQRAEHLERRHEVSRTRDTQHIGNGEQHIRHDLWVVRLPLEPRCKKVRKNTYLTLQREAGVKLTPDPINCFILKIV